MGQACRRLHQVTVGMNYLEIPENVWQQTICEPGDNLSTL